jgi:hypothetical protein
MHHSKRKTAGTANPAFSFVLFFGLCSVVMGAEQFLISDFEDGKFGNYQWGTEKFTAIEVTGEKAHTGKRSLKLSWKFENKGFAALGHGFGGPGQPQKFTMWVLGGKSGGILMVYMVDAEGEVFVHVLGKIDWEGWKEFTIPAAPTPTHWGGNNDVKIDQPVILRDITVQWEPGVRREGTIYIDDVSMETIIPAYGDASVSYTGQVFIQQNHTTPFVFTVKGYKNPPTMDYTLVAELKSEDGKEKSKGVKTFRLAHDKTTTMEIPLAVGGGKKADLKVWVQTPEGNVLCRNSSVLYLLPEVSKGNVEPDSVFGVTFNKNPHEAFKIGMIKWVRFDFDYSADNFEEEAKRVEEAVSRLEKDKVMALCILNPRNFASEYEPGKDDLKLAQWADWVKRVVTRLKGRVQYWEMANEPSNWKNPEVYVALAKTMYITAKKADPNCFLGGFASFVELPFFEFCLKAGMRDYFDFVTIHPYQWSHSFNDQLLLNDIVCLERLLKKYQCSRPIWISEMGWPTHPKGGSSFEVQGDTMAQYLLTIAGLEKYKTFLYTVGDWAGEPTDPETSFGIFDAGVRPKPAFYSFYIISKVLSSARSLGRAKLPAGFLGWRYLTKEGKLALSVWRPGEKPEAIKVRLPGLAGDQVEKIGMDLSRETIRAKEGMVELRVGNSPIILRYPSATDIVLPKRAPLVIVPKQTNSVFLACPKLPVCYPGLRATIPFGLANLTGKDISGTVALKLSRELGGKIIKKEITGKAGKETCGVFSFVIPTQTKNGKYTVEFSFPGCQNLAAELETGSRLIIEVEPINRSLSDKQIPLKVLITNPSREKLIGKLAMKVSGAALRPEAEFTLELEPGKTAAIERTLKVLKPTAEMVLELQGQIGTQPFNFKQRLDSIYIPQAKTITVDGNLNEWKDLPGFYLGRIEQVQQIKSWWAGPEDLSARVNWQWDEEYLYFAADVMDDIHCQRSVEGSTWMGDGFQIAFEVNGKFGYELCLAHTGTGPQLYALWTVSGQVGFVPGAKVATRREGKHTYYEVGIPWKALPPLAGRAGNEIRLDFILNENDGTTREGFLECRPGIGDSKSTKTWYRWRLGQ